MTTGIYPNPVHSSNVLGKIDHQFSGADQLSVRYALYDVVSDNARGVGNLNAPSGSTGLDNIDQSLAISNVWTISPNTVNETRVQIAHGDLEAYSTDQVGPQVTITGVATFGTFSSSPTRRENTLFQAVNNLSHRAGAHALRAGVDFLYNDDTITFLRTFRGSYSFSSMANFLTGNYNGYAQTFGDPVVTQNNPNVGVYAQDEWRASSRLTLNLGLRYDLQFLETINTDTNNISPRAGFAWTPTASQDLLVRGGAGSSSTGCRCAPSRTRCCRPATPPTSASSASRRCPAFCRRRPALPCSRISCLTAFRRRRSCRSRRWTRTCRTRTRSRPTSRSNERWAAAGRSASDISTSAARTC